MFRSKVYHTVLLGMCVKNVTEMLCPKSCRKPKPHTDSEAGE